MPSSPAISIITPTFNRRDALRRAITSVQAQNVDDYEHIIIDDASTDGTVRSVRELDDPRIRLVSLPGWKGANFARNAGIAEARSPLLTFLDSDDEFLPHRVSETLQFFQRHPDHHLHISSFETRKEDRTLPCINPSGYLPRKRWREALLTHAVFIAGSAVSVRHDLLKKVGGFDPGLRRMQDRDLLLRLGRLEGARLCSRVNWIKHRSPDSISAPREDYLRALSALIERHIDIARPNRTIVGYLVARTLLSDLRNLDWKHFREGLSENRSLPEFNFPLAELVTSYLAGKRIRRRILSSLREFSKNEIAL